MLANASLRTIDSTIHANLLDSSTALFHVVGEPQCVVQIDEPRANVWCVDQVLTDDECERLVAACRDQCGFASLNHAYAPNQRQAERLCVVDEQLSLLLWKRLAALLPHLVEDKVVPLGFYSTTPNAAASEWTPVGLNPCCRVSQYRAPSAGFTAHFDAPYVAAPGRRSTWSVVLYLTDVGETVFYDAPPGGGERDVAGLTIAEEISVRGGIGQYRQHRIPGKRGRCLVFPHDVLHAGAPLISSDRGPKIVLRTDVIVTNAAATLPSVSATVSDDHALAVAWFHEAQNRELGANVAGASEVYERALSLRRAAQHQSTLAKQAIWSPILFFLSHDDLAAVRACSRTFCAWVARNEAIRVVRWNKVHLGFDHLLTDISKKDGEEEEEEQLEQLEAHMKQHQPESYIDHEKIDKDADADGTRSLSWIPRFIARTGCRCYFTYRPSIFAQAPDACLRTLAMAAVFQFGVAEHSDTVVARYDADRGRVLACSRRDLLEAAFFEKPVTGAWYHVHRTVLGDLSLAKEEDGKKGKRGTKKEPPRELPLEEALGVSVDAARLPLHQGDVRTPKAILDQLARHQHLEARIDGGKRTQRRYRDSALIQRAQSDLPGFTLLNHESTCTSTYYCRCGLDGGVVDTEETTNVTALHYNNLICDLSRTNLCIQEVPLDSPLLPCGCKTNQVVAAHAQASGARHWIAYLDELKLDSFQHASCQCEREDITPQVIKSEAINFVQHTTLRHLHITQLLGEEASSGIFATHFVAANAL